MPKGVRKNGKNDLEYAAETFLTALNGKAENREVFIVLDQVARQRGLSIAAEQRGIHGTYIHFVQTS